MGSFLAPQPKVKTQPLFCPNCGGPIQMRGFAHTLSAVCPQCLSVLDATTPLLRTLQQIQAKMRREPKVPLGSRGKFGETTYEAIGFQTRATDIDGETYEWDEYVLFNPYKGFIYLSEYKGHWNVIRTVRAVPQVLKRSKPLAVHDSIQYQHFQRTRAETIFVLGEFPWQVKVGEDVLLDDYTAPPRVLSAERTEHEVTWSLGEYVEGKEIWKAFSLKGSPPAAHGTYVNQPDPNAGKPDSTWRLFKYFMLALAGLWLMFSLTSQNRKVLDEPHHYAPGETGERSFVTPTFELSGHTSNVVIETKTDLANNWLYVNYALINADTGQAWDFGREVTYYGSGSDSEGSKNDSVRIPAVPPGKYYLRVEPEGGEKGQSIDYEIVVRRDVPSMFYFIMAALLLLVPPVLRLWRGKSFEQKRWQESDYASKS